MRKMIIVNREAMEQAYDQFLARLWSRPERLVDGCEILK